jgi:hypothetical protein
MASSLLRFDRPAQVATDIGGGGHAGTLHQPLDHAAVAGVAPEDVGLAVVVEVIGSPSSRFLDMPNSHGFPYNSQRAPENSSTPIENETREQKTRKCASLPKLFFFCQPTRFARANFVSSYSILVRRRTAAILAAIIRRGCEKLKTRLQFAGATGPVVLYGPQPSSCLGKCTDVKHNNQVGWYDPARATETVVDLTVAPFVSTSRRWRGAALYHF